MPIEFRCTQCNKLLRTPDDTAGKKAKCPECGTVLAIPAATAPAAPSVPPPAAGPPPTPGAESPFGAGGPAPAAAGDPRNPYQSPGAHPAAPGAVAAAAGPLTSHPIDFGDIFGRNWAIFKVHWGTCLLALIVIVLIIFAAEACFLVAVMVVGAVTNSDLLTGLLAFLGYIGLFVLFTWISVGQVIFFLKVARGQEAAIGDLFTGGPYLLRALGAGLLFTLVVSLGMLLCVIPGVILGLMFSQFMFLIVDRNVAALDSFNLSKQITSGSKLTMFAILLVAGIVGELLVLVTCGLGALAVAPYLALLYPVIYLAMTGQPTADQLQPQPTQPGA